MKKGLIFLAISIIIVIVAIFSVLFKNVGKISSKNKSNSYDLESDALKEESSFDFKLLAKKIKESEYIMQVVSLNGKINIDENSDNIIVEITKSGFKYSNKFYFSNNTLYAKIFNESRFDNITYHIFDIAYSIKYINTNEIISSYIKNAEIDSYNLENSGLEIKNDEIKMKTDRRLNLIEFNNQYISKELVEKNSEKLNKEQLINFGNDNIKVLKTGTKKFMIISIAEKKKVTENTFKSLINILSVILDNNKIYEEFLNSHLDMKLKNEKTSDYTLEINPEKEEYEKLYFGEEPFIRFTLYGK